MTEVNIPLLRKCVEWAEAEAALGEKGTWNQGAFVALRGCGTAYCIAGYALHQEGWTDDQIEEGTPSPGHAAADALGIPRWAGDPGHLFSSENGIEDVRRIAEDIAGERL